MDPFLNDLLGSDNDEFQASTKTEEEIKKLTLEENMTEIKRTMHILTRGQPIQKASVYLNLNKILIEPDAFHKILPLISDDILNQTEENQIDGARSVVKLLNTKSLSQSNLVQIFQVTCSILKIWNQRVLDEWVQVFNELLKKLPYEVIARDCETTIMNLSETSQHTLSKYVAIRLIGFIAENGIKNTSQLFDRARILCQDPDFEIRKVLADEVMLKICYNAGTELTESKYLEKIMELLYDSNINIKLSAIDAIVKVTDILSSDFKKNRMISVFLDLMNSVNEDVMKKMSFHIGSIIYKLEDVVPKNSTQLIQMQTIYRDWSASKSAEMKKNILYNLPYMVTLFDNKDHWKSLYLKALKDSNKAIRITAISSFHEIAKVFKMQDSLNQIRDAFEVLLNDTDLETLDRIVKNLDELIAVFQSKRDENGDEEEKYKEEEKESKNQGKESARMPKETKETQLQSSYLTEYLKIADHLKSNCMWRTEVIFIKNINKSFDYFDIRELGEKYISYLIDRAARGLKDVQPLAIESLVQFLKVNYISKRSTEIMKTISHHFFGATNYQNRLLAVEIYNKFAENFSRRFFKTHGLNELAIKLGEDKVPVVKRKLFETSVTIRKMLNSNDASLIVKLDDAVNKGRLDSNKMVAEAGKEALKELKSLTQYFFADFEEEDKKRMQAEDLLKEREIKEAEEIKRRQSDEKDKGDYLYAFSNIIGGTSRKGPKKSTFKATDPLPKNGTKPTTFSYNPTPLVTPKTRPSVGTGTGGIAPLTKTFSSPSSGAADDEFKARDNGKSKTLTPGKTNGTLLPGKTGVPTSSPGGGKITASPDTDKLYGKTTGLKDKPKGYGDIGTKTEVKTTTSSTKLLTNTNTNTNVIEKSKDYVKVPIIKKKT